MSSRMPYGKVDRIFREDVPVDIHFDELSLVSLADCSSRHTRAQHPNTALYDLQTAGLIAKDHLPHHAVRNCG